jgi:Insertion element 4 transposase N-terminal/Transposase DDE domain
LFYRGVAVSNSVTTAQSDASRTAVFAAGHLGELTWQVPVELVDAVLAETKTTQRRLRDLPSRVGVYFVLACCLFPALGYRKVWAKLTATIRGRKAPSEKAFRDLRRRIGAAPLKALFEVLAGPIAAPRTPGVRFGRYRTVAFDGCVSFKVPDTDRNRSWLGKLTASLGVTGYPVVRLMTVVETGTRALLGAVFGPPATGEIEYARALLPLLGTDMLVLADRGFDAQAFLADLAGTGAKFLVRLRATRRPALLVRLDDGSYLSRIGALRVRIITADVTVTCADGTHYSANYRLATTLLDPRRYPAPAHRPLPRTLGTRDRLPGAAPQPRRRPRAAIDRPRRAATRNLGAAARLPGTAACHGQRGRIPARHRPRPGQLHHRTRNRQRSPGQRRQHHRRRRPRGTHRPRRARQPAPAAASAHQRPESQIPAIALQQKRPLPAPRQHDDHQHHRHHHRPRPEMRDTPTEIVDNSPQPLTTRHWS